MNRFGAVLWVTFHKELRAEARTKEVLSTTLLFALLVAVLSSLSMYLDPTLSRKVAPGALWLSIAFSGMLAVGRAWSRERDNEVFQAVLLSPAPPGALYAGKTLAIFLFVLVVDCLLLALVTLFFNLTYEHELPTLLAFVFLGTFGFVFAASLFGALTVHTSARDLALSTVVFPLVAPALLGATVATRELFAGASLAELRNYILLLLAYDLVFAVSGMLLFGPTVRGTR